MLTFPWMKTYEPIDHTADVGIRSFGETLEELFRNAAVGMFDIIADLGTVGTTATREIRLSASNLEELYLSWHQELLFRSAVDGVVYKEFIFRDISETTLLASVRGEKFNPDKQSLKKEIKAATYHALKVQKTKEGWVGEIIFDV